MFEQAILVAPGRAGRTWSTMAGVAAQSALLTAAVLVPLVFPDSLPKVETVVSLLYPLTPPPPPPPPTRTSAARTATAPQSQMRDNVLFTPTAIPASPKMIIEEPLADATGTGVEGGVPGGTDRGILNGILNSVLDRANAMRAAAPPPKPAPVEATRSAAPPVKERIAVSSGVQEAKIIKRVIPVYPALARQARISGQVQLHGVIGTDGRIRELRIVRGHPLLARAALDSVSQWIYYHPTLLNGVPVEVEAPIIVNFTLN